MIRRRALISGHVQGVYYRDMCRSVAQSHGVAGWARNLPDLRVEVVLEGDQDAVEAVLEWCRKGPPRARVSSVEVIEEEPEGETGFEVLW